MPRLYIDEYTRALRGKTVCIACREGILRDHMAAVIADVKGVLDCICSRIDHGHYDRVHILPAAKNAIKHELFTIEGFGTLIANNFVERFHPVGSEDEVRLIDGIFNLYKNEGYERQAASPGVGMYFLELY